MWRHQHPGREKSVHSLTPSPPNNCINLSLCWHTGLKNPAGANIDRTALEADPELNRRQIGFARPGVDDEGPSAESYVTKSRHLGNDVVRCSALQSQLKRQVEN